MHPLCREAGLHASLAAAAAATLRCKGCSGVCGCGRDHVRVRARSNRRSNANPLDCNPDCVAHTRAFIRANPVDSADHSPDTGADGIAEGGADRCAHGVDGCTHRGIAQPDGQPGCVAVSHRVPKRIAWADSGSVGSAYRNPVDGRTRWSHDRAHRSPDDSAHTGQPISLAHSAAHCRPDGDSGDVREPDFAYPVACIANGRPDRGISAQRCPDLCPVVAAHGGHGESVGSPDDRRYTG